MKEKEFCYGKSYLAQHMRVWLHRLQVGQRLLRLRLHQLLVS